MRLSFIISSIFILTVTSALMASVDLDTFSVRGKIYSFNEKEVSLKTESGIQTLSTACFTQEELKSTKEVVIDLPCKKGESYKRSDLNCHYAGGTPRILTINRCQDGGFTYCYAKIRCDGRPVQEVICPSEGKRLCPSNPHDCMARETTLRASRILSREVLKREVVPLQENPSSKNLPLHERRNFCAKLASKESGGGTVFKEELDKLCSEIDSPVCTVTRERLLQPITAHTKDLNGKNQNDGSGLLKAQGFFCRKSSACSKSDKYCYI